MAILSKIQLLANRCENIYPNENKEVTATKTGIFLDNFIDSIYYYVDNNSSTFGDLSIWDNRKFGHSGSDTYINFQDSSLSLNSQGNINLITQGVDYAVKVPSYYTVGTSCDLTDKKYVDNFVTGITSPILSSLNSHTGNTDCHFTQAQICIGTSQISNLSSYTGFDTRYSLTGHNHNGIYEPVFSKNTAFNKNFGTTAGTVAEGNDCRIIKGLCAYNWGDHNIEGYLTIESDPIFVSSAAYGITSTDITNWNTVYNNNHSAVTLGTNTNGLSLSGQVLELDLATTTKAGAMSAQDKIDVGYGATAYGWGDHTTMGYLDYNTPAADITSQQIIEWDAAYCVAHNAVTIGTKANGLSLDGQVLELDLATTTKAGAMSTADKIKLNSALVNGSNLFTLKNTDVDVGEPIPQGGSLVIKGGNTVTVDRTNNELTIDATFNGLTSINEGAGIVVSGSGNSRTIAARIGSNMTWVDDGANNAIDIDTSKVALQTDLHNAVTIGIKPNGLSLDGQAISLSLATTSNAGAMSTADKIKLNSALVSGANLFTLKNTDVDVGEPISQGGSLVIKGGNTVTVDRTDNELTIDAIFNGLTSINEGSGIAVSGSGSSRTVAARIGSNMTWVADGSNNAIDIDTTKVALKTDLHNAVTLGIKPNGLSLDGQAISLSLATTSNAGAMSAGDKTILNNLSSNLFTLKSNDVEDGIDITAGDTVTIQGSDNVQVLRSGSTLTITTNTSSGGITTLNGGIAIDVTGVGSSRTISAKVDNDTIIIDELNNQMTASVNLGVTTATTCTTITNSAGNNAILSGATTSMAGLVTTGAQYWDGAKCTNSCFRAPTLCATTRFIATTSGVKFCGATTSCGVAGDWVATSDCRVKTNIYPISNALSTVIQLCGVNYNLCDDESNQNNVGLIAQDVEKVLPEIVSKNEPSEDDLKYGITDQKLGLKYDKLTAVLVEAIKEQQKQIEELKSEILKMKGI